MHLVRSELHHALAEHSGILRMLFLIHGYLNGPYEPLARVVVRRVVRSRQGLEHIYQIFVGILLQLRAESRIGRYLGNGVIAGHRLDVQSRASAEYDRTATGHDVIVRSRKISLVTEDIVAHPGIHDVYQMIGHRRPLVHVLAEVLPGTNVHSAVYLPRVGRNNLSSCLSGQLHRIAGLARSRRPQDYCKPVFFHIVHIHCCSRFNLYSLGDIPVLRLKKRLMEVCSGKLKYSAISLTVSIGLSS